jgi:hypothetical protein
MRKNLVSLWLVFLVFLAGCTTFYRASITLTGVVDVMMKNWADMSVSGQTSPQIDAAVMQAHEKYREAALVAKRSLEAYKAGGSVDQYVAAFEAAKTAADGIFAIIRPLLASHEAGKLQSQLQKATLP